MTMKTEGKWSMDDAGTYFLATGFAVELNGWTDSWLYAVNHLDAKASKIQTQLDAGCRVLLDSGVFSLASDHARVHNVTHDEALATPVEELDGFDELMAKWKVIVNANRKRLWGYIEIDLGGMEGKIKTRTKLESEGYRPIPVIHPLNDGWDYFEDMADRYDRLCIGNLVGAQGGQRESILQNVFERRQGRKVKWIHALGVTPSPTWFAFPTESCDSSSLHAPMRWGRELNEYSSWRASWMTREIYTSDNIEEMHRIQPCAGGLLDQQVRSKYGSTAKDRRQVS